jgi:nicotinate-nucleotide pyrophosphorylase (carboxylating)
MLPVMDKTCAKTIDLAYHEDIGNGDITTELTVSKQLTGKAVVVAKSNGILSGSDAFAYVYGLASKNVTTIFHIRDGARFKAGSKIVAVTGSARALLKGERLALNLLSHFSGVATQTAEFVTQIKGTKARILDTRKTTPGLRWLEKKAVKDGGGQNHRFGLYDMILIKDNHIAAAGGIRRALERTKTAKYKVEIEVASFAQLDEALGFQPDIIMLDNFRPSDLPKAVKLIRSKRPRIKIEASGGVNLKTVKSIARSGVDYISIGALTHSVRACDFSMRYYDKLFRA